MEIFIKDASAKATANVKLLNMVNIVYFSCIRIMETIEKLTHFRELCR